MKSRNFLAVTCALFAIYLWPNTNTVTARSSEKFAVVYQMDHEGIIQDIDWLPQESVLAYLTNDSSIFVLDMNEEQRDVELQLITDAHSIAWRPVQNELVILGRSISFWDLEMQNFFEFDGLEIGSPELEGVRGSIDWSTDGNFFTFYAANSVKDIAPSESRISFYIFDASENTLTPVIEGIQQVDGAEWAINENVILLAEGELLRLIMADGTVIQEIVNYSDFAVDHTTWGHQQDSTLFVSGATFQNIFVSIWDYRLRRELTSVTTLNARVTTMDWNESKKILATGHQDGSINTWIVSEDYGDIELHNSLEINDANGAISALAWNSEGTQLATGNIRGNFVIWNLLDSEIPD